MTRILRSVRRVGRDRKAGFALVELLVALALLALLAAMLGTGVHLAGRLTGGAAVARTAADAVANTQLVLRQRLQRLAPVPPYGGSGSGIDLRGLPTELWWVGPPAAQAQPDSLFYHRLALTPDRTLTLYTLVDLDRRVDPTAPGLAGWTPHPLLREVRDLDIAYFGATPAGPRRWVPVWRERGEPPELIRIRLGFAPGDARQWPDLLIRPRTTVSAACRINPRTGVCEAV